MENKKATIVNLKELYHQGYKCILYESNKQTHDLTVYMKNFENENTITLEYRKEDADEIKKYIDTIS